MLAVVGGSRHTQKLSIGACVIYLKVAPPPPREIKPHAKFSHFCRRGRLLFRHHGRRRSFQDATAPLQAIVAPLQAAIASLQARNRQVYFSPRSSHHRSTIP